MGPIIHLSAKVTIHNRGTMRVNVANSVMRVTAYPLMGLEKTQVYVNQCSSTPDWSEDWCKLANGFDPSGFEQDTDFRSIQLYLMLSLRLHREVGNHFTPALFRVVIF